MLRSTPSTMRRCASLMTMFLGCLRASPAFRAFSRAARAAAPASALMSLSALSFACVCAQIRDLEGGSGTSTG